MDTSLEAWKQSLDKTKESTIIFPDTPALLYT